MYVNVFLSLVSFCRNLFTVRIYTVERATPNLWIWNKTEKKKMVALFRFQQLTMKNYA